MGLVVVGIDGSELSRRALDEAMREADWRGASVLAVHVVHVATAGMYPAAGFIDLATQLIEDGRRALEDELAAMRARCPEYADVTVEGRVVSGHTGDEIIRASDSSTGDHAELVVLGSRGFGGFRGLLLGSVTTYVIHHLPCPVLVIPGDTNEES